MFNLNFKSWFDTQLKGLWSALKNLFNSKRAKLIADVYEIVLPIVEEVTKMDWNNDGVVKHSREEILEIVKANGGEWGEDISKTLLNALPTDDLKKYLVVARIFQKWAAKQTTLPKWSMSAINIAIEIAVQTLKDRGETPTDGK
jgi:hypothetical protein